MPMVVCEVDAVVGGRFRYVWSHPKMGEMGMSGTFLELEPGSRIVHDEVFDDDWTGGPTHINTRFLPDEAGCRLEMTVRYRSNAAVEGALKTGMTEGMSEGFDALDGMLAG